MASTEMRVPMATLARRLTMKVRVTGMRRWQVRWWAARMLLRMAAAVAGMSIQIEQQG